MQILLDNFIEAWINAIKYHDKIMDGYITLGIQKQFVSSLHNAVELCLKQIMLDKNTAIPLNKSNENESKADEIISNIKQIKNDIVLKSKIEEFNQNNNNLNHFFAVLDSEKMKDIHTIGFKDLIGKSKELIGIDVKDTLKLLNELRNDETHFYIDNSFLSDENFCKLHNFMIVFGKFFVKGKLNVKIECIQFMQIIHKNFSYKNAILDNELPYKIKKLSKKINGMSADLWDYALDMYTNYRSDFEHSDYIEEDFTCYEEYTYPIDYTHEDIYEMLLAMENAKLINVERVYDDFDDRYVFLTFNF